MPDPRSLLLTVLALAACGGGGSDGPTTPDACTGATLALHADIAAPIPAAAAGTSTIAIAGTYPRSLATARASAFEIGADPNGFTIIDVPVTDATGHPTGELFLYLDEVAKAKKFLLEPITLPDLQTQPTFSFVLYAEGYDADQHDYTRWLLGTSGCVTLAAVQPGRVSRVRGDLTMSGEWQTLDGDPLGAGTAHGSFDAPLLRVLTPTASLRDTLTAQASGARADQLKTGTVDAFQVLAPEQTRLAIVGTVPAAAATDSVRELWLSINGVPKAGDVVSLNDPTLGDAMRGRASVSFAMMRVIERIGVPAQPYVRQLWRSTSGSVTFTNVVQNGPLGFCGWASGEYQFESEGAALLASGAESLGTAAFTGAFETKFTPLAPHDTLEDDAKSSLLLTFARRSAPRATTEATCTF